MSILYQEHFGLNQPPFQITPDIDYFFSGSQRGDLLGALLHVASHEEGIVTVTAEVGSGKTLLARLMISRLPPDVSTVYLSNPCFSRDEIISAISRDLGLTDLPASIEEKLACLHQELLRRHANGERVLLVIDEAHAMPAESLEEVRLLSNLETGHNKLVNIMLFGQPELDTLLADPRLRQVRDRVIHRFDLLPFSRDDGTAYIDHRLRVAGWQGGKLFSASALALLMKASGGRARRINLLADKSMLAAYSENLRQVEKRHAKNAYAELQPPPLAARRRSSSLSTLPWIYIFIISLALSIVMSAAALLMIGGYRIGIPAQRAGIPELAVVPAHPTQPAVLAEATNQLSVTPQAAEPARKEKPAAPAQSLEDAQNATSATNPPPAATSQAKEAVAPAPRADAKNAQPPPAARNTLLQTDEVIQRTADLLKNQQLQGYTLQTGTLPAGTDLTNYFKNLDRSVDYSSIYAHNENSKGQAQVVIYMGQYKTEQEAKIALNNLPNPLKANQPLIRTWARIRQEQKL